MSSRRSNRLALPLAGALALAAGCATAQGGGSDAGGAKDDARPRADAAPSGPDASSCPTEPCDILAQCGCTDPQVCDLDSQNPAGTACRDVANPGTEEANCTTLDDCAGGYVCLGPSGGTQCRKYCDNDQDCGNGGHCLINITYNMGMQTGWTTCTKSCSPELASNNGCPSDPQLGCQFYLNDPDGVAGNGDEFWLSDCGAAHPAGTDEVDCSVNGNKDCAPGFTCIQFSDADGNLLRETCKQICVVGGGGPACQTGTCQSLTNDAPPTIEGKEFGICNG